MSSQLNDGAAQAAEPRVALTATMTTQSGGDQSLDGDVSRSVSKSRRPESVSPPRVLRRNREPSQLYNSTRSLIRERSASHPLDEEQDLRARLELAERRLEIAERRLNNWRVAARQVLNVVALGPRSNERYKREIAENLERIIMKLDQVNEVHFIDCSFPAIEAQAPDFEMLSWDSLALSRWFVRWSPSWSVEVSLGGWHYIPFTLVIHVSNIKVNGRFRLSLAPDMSYAWVSFDKDIHVDMTVSCEVTWGVVNVPLQATIEGMVKKGFDDWLRSALIEPNRMRIPLLAEKLSEEEQFSQQDLEKARLAAKSARKRATSAEDMSWTAGIVSMVTLSSPVTMAGTAGSNAPNRESTPSVHQHETVSTDYREGKMDSAVGSDSAAVHDVDQVGDSPTDPQKTPSRPG